MLRIIAVSTNPARLPLLYRMFPQLEIFPGTPGDRTTYREIAIPDTYHRLAVWAVEEGLDRRTIVIQDDVWMPHGDGLEVWNDSPELDHPLVIFGSTDSKDRICPKAFSADRETWELLVGAWPGTGRVCETWRPLVDSRGLVLNVTEELSSQPSV